MCVAGRTHVWEKPIQSISGQTIQFEHADLQQRKQRTEIDCAWRQYFSVRKFEMQITNPGILLFAHLIHETKMLSSAVWILTVVSLLALLSLSRASPDRLDFPGLEVPPPNDTHPHRKDTRFEPKKHNSTVEGVWHKNPTNRAFTVAHLIQRNQNVVTSAVNSLRFRRTHRQMPIPLPK
jgi:hypothetical protein